MVDRRCTLDIMVNRIKWRPGNRGTDWASAGVYALGVVVWAVQPSWLAQQPLLPALLLTVGLSVMFGLLSGSKRSLAAPGLFGLLIGAVAAATTNGDLGRTGELALGAIWGLLLAGTTALGAFVRRGLQRTGA
jgi:hypothetical protein